MFKNETLTGKDFRAFAPDTYVHNGEIPIKPPAATNPDLQWIVISTVATRESEQF
jgi:hypothetical protein